MELLQAIRERRTIRRFKPDPIPRELLEQRACKIFCVKSKSWYNHFIQNGGLQNGKKETQPCKCSRYRPYF